MGAMVIQQTSLALGAAQAALDKVCTALQADGKTAVVAVSDAQGELLSFARLDGAPLPSITVACNKAWTAARMNSETSALGRLSREGEWDFAFFGDPRYIGWGGGVPVRLHGRVIGAVAVSGLSQEEDERYARLGVEVLESV
jgi:glc operon protein GlcG